MTTTKEDKTIFRLNDDLKFPIRGLLSPSLASVQDSSRDRSHPDQLCARLPDFSRLRSYPDMPDQVIHEGALLLRYGVLIIHAVIHAVHQRSYQIALPAVPQPLRHVAQAALLMKK